MVPDEGCEPRAPGCGLWKTGEWVAISSIGQSLGQEVHVSGVEGLERWARQTPIAAALVGVEPEASYTYAQLRDRVFGLAGALRACGVHRSDVVLVSLPNGPGNLIAILGAMLAAVCAPMNPAYTREELGRLAADVSAVAVVTDTAQPSPAADLAHDLGLPIVTLGDGHPRSEFEEVPPDATALLLHTAGTTAHPKQVPLSHANLAAAARNVVASLHLTPRDRCLNVMPLFHSHGLLGAALSTLAAGGSIVCTPGMDPRHFLEWARAFECTWYTAAPTVHRLVLDAPGEWGGFRFMRSASAPLPPQVAERLEERFSAPMIEVYGMTEAYQIAANPLPPGERRRGSVGRPTGTNIAMLDQAGLVRTQGEGEILVRGPAVFSGYSAPPDANEDAFVEGWFRTGDIGSIGADGYLTITGRAKEQINRAGEKISPREVEEALLDFRGIVDALAFAVPDPLLGEDVVAAVVPEGDDLDVGAIRRSLAARLAAFKIPKRFVVVDSIPRSDTGKHQRRAFALAYAEGRIAERKRAERGPSMPTGFDVPRLAEIWRDVLKLELPPVPTDRFFDLGGDSLAVMEMVVQVERDFGIDLPLVAVHQVPTLGELAAYLDQIATDGTSDALLGLYRRGSDGTRVVLVPGQYGHSVGLNRIADAIGRGPDIYLFDYPGHREGQAPARSIEDLGSRLVEEIVQAGVAQNLVLYGNSMGGWVVLDAAGKLGALGLRPAAVVIGDMYSPYFNVHRSEVRPGLTTLARNGVRRLVKKLAQLDRRPHDDASPDALALRRQEAVRRASELAQRAFRGPHHYQGDVLVVSTASRAARFGETLGYDRHVSGRVSSLRVEGEHSEMHVSQSVPIGQALAELCRKAVSPG